MVATSAYLKAVQRNPALQQDAERLLTTYGVGDLAALESALRMSLAGHRAMGAAAYGVPPELEVQLLALAQVAIRVRLEHGNRSQQAKAIGTEALNLIRSQAPLSLDPLAGHDRAKAVWGSAIRKAKGQS